MTSVTGWIKSNVQEEEFCLYESDLVLYKNGSSVLNFSTSTVYCEDVITVECIWKEDLQDDVQYKRYHRCDGQLSSFFHGCHWYQNLVLLFEHGEYHY